MCDVDIDRGIDPLKMPLPGPLDSENNVSLFVAVPSSCGNAAGDVSGAPRPVDLATVTGPSKSPGSPSRDLLSRRNQSHMPLRWCAHVA